LSQPPPAVAEPLEHRRLCNATALVRRGRLVIVGDDNPTTIVVTTSPNRRQVQVTIDGVLIDPNPNGGPTTGVRRSRVHRVFVTTGAGNDNIQIGLFDVVPHRRGRRLFLGRATVFAGAGDDNIQGGPQGDVLIGGPGNDTIVGGDNNDLLFGGSGDDHISGNFRRDNLFGQDGNDTLEGGQGSDALYGMAGDDTLTGGVDNDFLNGGPGDNTFLDANNEPELGERHDVQQYMKQLVKLSVPHSFRQRVFT
jgi:Ca2+-binding RTX toxin-like protein